MFNVDMGSVQCWHGIGLMLTWDVFNVDMGCVQCWHGMCSMLTWDVFNVDMGCVQCWHGMCSMLTWDVFNVDMGCVQCWHGNGQWGGEIYLFFPGSGRSDTFNIFDFLSRWKVRSPRHPSRPGAWYHGLCPIRSIRADLPARQLRLRTEWRRKQLGERSLHGGSRVGRLRPGCSAQGGRELWLSPGIPVDPLPRRRHWIGHGHAPHQQDPWGVSRPNHEHILRRSIAKGNPLLSGMTLYNMFLNLFQPRVHPVGHSKKVCIWCGLTRVVVLGIDGHVRLRISRGVHETRAPYEQSPV